MEATQEQVYGQVSPLVVSVMDGYNACIFAYGQVNGVKLAGVCFSPTMQSKCKCSVDTVKSGLGFAITRDLCSFSDIGIAIQDAVIDQCVLEI